MMLRADVAQPVGWAAAYCRPVVGCLILLALCALVGCQRVEPVSHGAPDSPSSEQPSLPEPPAQQHDHALSRRVDRGDLKEMATVIAEGTWWREGAWRSNHRDLHIKDIEITHRKVLEAALIPGQTATLVVADVEASWWKTSCEVLMVFGPLSYGTREPLLVFDGGYAGAGLDYEVIDLSTEDTRPALVVRDNWHAMSVSGTYTHVFVHVPRKYRGRPELREVFSEQTEYWHPAWGDAMWTDTKIEFRDGGREMKDIAITAHVEKWHGNPDWSKPKHEHENPDYYQTIDEERTWVFTWDGERYVGKIDVDEH